MTMKKTIGKILLKIFQIILALSVPLTIVGAFVWWFATDFLKAAAGLVVFASFGLPFIGCLTGIVVTYVPILLKPFPDLIKIIWKILVGKKEDRKSRS